MKRSRETPAREHPSSEQRIAEKEQRHILPNNTSKCSESELKILEVIGEQVVDLEFISQQMSRPDGVISAHLTMLELSGLLERIDGDRFRRKFFKNTFAMPDNIVKGFVKKFVKHLKKCRRGIARKYLHFYIARFWCVVDRDRWKEGELLKVCVRSHHSSRDVLTIANAPLLVQLPVLAA